jgi:rubrerythrin
MSEFFSAAEIIQFAIKIEENGESFYRNFAKNVKDEKIGGMFNLLADEELKHRRIFEGMAQRLEDFQPQESYSGEHLEFLRNYANEHIFTEAKKGALVAQRLKNTQEALEFALSIEIDSILYYLEAKDLISLVNRATLDEIVDQERRHYLKLLQVKNSLHSTNYFSK